MGINIRAIFFGCFAILAVYHILVYIGRRKDYLNLIYSFYCLAIANVVLVSLIFPDQYDTAEFAIYFVISCHLIAGTLMLFFYVFLDILTSRLAMISIFYYAFLSIVLPVLITLAVILKNHIILYWYSPLIFLFGIYTIITIILKYMIGRKINDRKSAIIIAGFTIVIIYLVTFSFLIIFKIKLPHTSAYSVFLINALLFAYALTDNFNQEHKDLIDMKNTLEEKVIQRTKQLDEANQIKTAFFINVAHEIKTPLTLIGNYLDKDIQKRGLSREIEIVKNNVGKLKNDMLNYLDFEKLERGMVFYDNNRIVDVTELLKEKLKLFEDVASKKQIKITSSVMENVFLKIDPYALDRIINNLLDNAIKYNVENGEIHITLDYDAERIRIIIQDTGIGIPLDQMKNIFEPYHQISHSKRNIQGIGMGLNIVKKIVADVNGEIHVESEMNKGAVFTLFFAKCDITGNHIDNNDMILFKHEISSRKINLKNEIFNKDKKIILIVEDNPDMLIYLQDELCCEYNVFNSSNGKDALYKIISMPKPDMIISDLMMDEMDGFEFFSELSKKPDYSSIPFIFLTAKTSKEDKIEGLKKGAIDYIFKPFSIDELSLKISSILKLNEKQRESNINEIRNAFTRIFDENLNMNSEHNMNFSIICSEYNINLNEKNIINLLFKGFEYKEIGNELDLSLNIVKKRINCIYNKLKVNNKVELINKFQKYIP